jgi:hypothetical protein
MGGNGYYWVIGFDRENPACMEVRKLDSGMRAWAAKPGEHYLQTSGEKSGLWRNRGRAPQKLTGVGFIAEGFETSASYRKMPDAWHRTVSWITEGVEERSLETRVLPTMPRPESNSIVTTLVSARHHTQKLSPPQAGIPTITYW